VIFSVAAAVFDGSLHVTVSDNGVGGRIPAQDRDFSDWATAWMPWAERSLVTSPLGERNSLALGLPSTERVR
jgi:hypothetical protein